MRTLTKIALSFIVIAGTSQMATATTYSASTTQIKPTTVKKVRIVREAIPHKIRLNKALKSQNTVVYNHRDNARSKVYKAPKTTRVIRNIYSD